MRASVVLVVALAACVFCAVPSTDETHRKFQDYISKYGRIYSTDEEYQHRYNNFLNTLERIAKKNAASKKHVLYAVTKFADQSEEEIMQRRMPAVSASNYSTSCLANGVTAPVYTKERVAAIPDSFDWRDKGAVTPVKNQGQCGSCWAFSTTGNIESQWIIKGHTPSNFSEQLIVDCSTGCTMVEGQAVCNSGCDGGWPWSAMFDIISWGGLETEDEYPYVGVDETCAKNSKELVAPLKNYTCLGTDEGQMATFLYQNGPLSVALDADLVEDYDSGIIDPWFPSEECDPTSLDHAVLLVGYGVESDVFGSTPFWIVKNSWGADWGENGYFRIYRGDGVCGINNAVSSAILA